MSKVIKKLCIYNPRYDIILEIIHGPNECFNRLDTSNNRLLRPKNKYFNIEALPIIKKIS